MIFTNISLVDRQTGEEETDHIDSDTPRSGIATPVPDPSDKRLPGIIHSSYFGQVGKGSSTSPTCSVYHSKNTALGSESGKPKPSEKATNEMLPVASKSSSEPERDCDVNDESSKSSFKEQLDGGGRQGPAIHPYPTPPTSSTPSLHKLKLSDSSSDGERHRAAANTSKHRKSISDSFPSHSRRGSSMLNPLSNIVTASNVHATHFSNPSEPHPSTTPYTPVDSKCSVPPSPSYDRLKALTDDAANPREKSTPSTPTRALSNQTAASDASTSTRSEKAANTSSSTPDVPVPKTSAKNGGAVRGKLTVKIREARGIRRSQDPYVVAVFQRNELVSKGPRVEEDDEEEMKSPMAMGGIPISRTASDTGRPPMAIPMKSRQSSNTSLTDYREFKKSKARRATTSPVWDTEAVL